MLRDMTVLDTVTISPCGLAKLIRESPATTLVVDCRGFTEFNESHINGSVNAFFSKLIRRRLFEKKLDDNCLLHQLMNCPGRMDDKLDVVLYAEEEKPRGNKRRIASCNAPESSVKILRVLRERLEETDKFRSVMILEGGYKQFATEYPQLCDSSEKMTRLPQSLSQPCLMNPKGDGITMITPNVYLGSEKDSMDEKTLKALDITTVINLSVTCEKSVCIKEDKNFMRIPVNDSYQEKLSPFFSEAYEFLEKCRMSGRKCLIHCLAGISRSPTLCISYIMRHHRVGSEEAYRYVKDRRPSISPNFNFMGQLLEYENQLINENVLGLDQASRPYHRIDKLSTMHTAKCRTVADLCPPKVPKSASSHCVFTPNLTQTLNKIGDASPTTSDSEEPSNQLNENGKRGMTLELPMRPRALGLPSRVMSVGQDLPSPSTELSRLSFDGVDGAMNCRKDDNRLAYSNPCFLSPVQPTREISLPLGNVMENPLYYQQQKKSDCETSGSQTAPVSTSKSMGFMLRAKKFVGHKIVGSRTSRPECLRSAGLMIPPSMISGQLLATTEEDDAESPESGVVIESCPDDDSISISSGSSLEITCQ